MSDRSRGKFLEFLDYLGSKGLVSKNTIEGRKAAAGKVFGILSEEEADDVTQLDLDEVMRRFQNLKGQKYTPGSLNTYLSRLRSGVDDFKSYLENPLAFRPSAQTRDRKPKNETKKVSEKGSGPVKYNSDDDRPTPRVPIMPSSSIIPIPIRPDLTVHIQGIPFDLTETEAAKIANVIRAMANLTASK